MGAESGAAFREVVGVTVASPSELGKNPTLTIHHAIDQSKAGGNCEIEPHTYDTLGMMRVGTKVQKKKRTLKKLGVLGVLCS